MRLLLFPLLALVIASQAGLLNTSQALGEGSQTDFLAGFVVGRYRLIGQQPDAGTTYSGEVEIYREGQSSQLKVRRIIADRVVEGAAAIESALHGEAMVLRMRFRENGTAHESTCLVKGDLDNYARLSCQLYRQDGKTRQAGLEALFHAPATR